MMNKKDRSVEATAFAQKWEGRGYEKGESQTFWLELLQQVYGVEKPFDFIKFEKQVKLDKTSFIDCIIPSTEVLIEQKSITKDLKKAIKQSDGTFLTPFQQAKRYSSELPYSDRPRWIILCNFKEFHIYDMEKPNAEPEIIKLKDLKKEYYRMDFLVDNRQNEVLQREKEISVKAGELVGKLYDELLKEYKDPDNPETLKSLNELIVRLVFCLYAEDAGIFPEHMQFHNYLKGQTDPRTALIKLFRILDTPDLERDLYESDSLLAFPYVNGGLFSNHHVETPKLTDNFIHLLLEDASEGFDWSEISPTIFGAAFESTLNPETRRSGGMHYTSIENIHKVIDPLFLNERKNEFNKIVEIKQPKRRSFKLEEFQNKIASLTFLDPACGSGNFLTETYLSLRRLENQILNELAKIRSVEGQQMIATDDYVPIKVSIQQFYGIEINDFAVSVAKTALWIAEHQMMKETEKIFNQPIDFLPLRSYTNIHEVNALHLDWNDVVSADEVDYIFGNPPFAGYSLQTPDQKADIRNIFVDKNGNQLKNSGKNDYVSCWFYKACSFFKNQTKIAFVATNSITQGEQVSNVWKPIIDYFNVEIEYAYTTFRWDNEASEKAAVHCVIIGLRKKGSSLKEKTIFSDNTRKLVDNISPYIINAPDVVIGSRRKPICNVPLIVRGSQPTDHGYFFLSAKEREVVLASEPELLPYIHQVYGSEEFINGKLRYCFWLKDVDPKNIVRSKILSDRVKNVRDFRLKSKKKATRIDANRPAEFQEIRQPNNDYLLIPETSSENRRYIPIGFINKEIIALNSVRCIKDSGKYEFGILTSNVHMAWMRTVAGRLKSDYRYSNDVVYNNFPWPTPTKKQKALIEKTADAILKAREKYSESTLAEMYTNLEMYPELNKAHQMNDRAVMDAYGFSWKGDNAMSESDCVSALMQMYKELDDEDKLKKMKS